MAHTDDSHMTRVVTAWSVCSKTIQPAGMLLGGVLAAATSIRTALLLSGLLLLLSIPFLPWRATDRAAGQGPASAQRASTVGVPD